MTFHSFLRFMKDSQTQILLAIFATLNMISDGMHVAWPSPTTLILLRDGTPFRIQNGDVVWLELLMPIFVIFALPFIVYFADHAGRKKLILISTCIGLMSWSLIGFGYSKEFLYAARSSAGAAVCVSFVSSPIFISEIANEKIRGLLVSVSYVMFHIGVIIMYSIGPHTSMRIPPIIGSCILLVQLVTLICFPESPYHHLIRNNENAAKKTLVFYQGSIGTDRKLESMKEELKRKRKEFVFKDLLTTRKYYRILFLMIILNFAPPATGYISILMNLNAIIEYGVSNTISSYGAVVVFSVVTLVASIFSMVLVDKFGRKILLMISAFISGLALFILGIFFHLKISGYDISTLVWIPAVFLNVYVAFYKLGLGTVPIVLCAEICPIEMRSLGMAIADFLYNLSSCASLYFYHYVLEVYGFHVVFYSFAFVAMISIILSYITVPETRGKTLLEVQCALEN